MTLQEIDAFLSAVQFQSLTLAANALYITQPTLSYRLSSLEKELGVILIERKRGQKGISLTPHGTKFIPQAQKWKQLWRETTDAMAHTPSHRLPIAASLSIDSYILPEVIWRFMRQDLSVRFRSIAPLFPEAYHMLETKQVDLAFYSMSQYSRNILAAPIYRERLIFVCSNGSHYPVCVEPSSLSSRQEVYIGKIGKNGWSPEFTDWHIKQFPEGTPYLENINIPLLDEIFDIPDRWGIMPISIAEPYIKAKKIETRKSLHIPSYREVFMLHHKDTPLNAHYALFLDTLKDVISEKEGFELLF